MNAWNSMCHPEVSKKERMVWIASSKIKLLKQRTIYSPTGLSYPTKECAKANILELLSKMSVRKNFATQFHPSTVAMMFGIHFQNNVHLGKTLSAWIETVLGECSNDSVNWTSEPNRSVECGCYSNINFNLLLSMRKQWELRLVNRRPQFLLTTRLYVRFRLRPQNSENSLFPSLFLSRIVEGMCIQLAKPPLLLLMRTHTHTHMMPVRDQLIELKNFTILMNHTANDVCIENRRYDRMTTRKQRKKKM